MPSRHAIPLPEYEKPPITEVFISVEFAPLSLWQPPHAGLYWGRIQDRFPKTEVHPPIMNFQEQPGLDVLQPTLNINLNFEPPLPRTWFLTGNSVFIIQIQRDRFILNWRKVTGDEIYPRFENTIRPMFMSEWISFKKFINDLGLGEITIAACEVSYINDIVKGADWNDLNDASSFFSFVNPHGSDNYLPGFETFGFSSSFRNPDENGRLKVFINHAKRQRDGAEIVQLHLNARGHPKSDSDEDLLEWVNFGREWIVRGFTDMTTKKAHALWERRV